MKYRKRENEFKTIIKFLREQNRMSQSQLGAVLGYGYTAVSNYESGRNEPSIGDLIKLADYFQVSVDFLIGHKYDEKMANNLADYMLMMKIRTIRDSIIEVADKMNDMLKTGN
ncbi:helix-turn-helix domain-containing protein [Lachnospiraceae bacterium NSJ-143]|nr:helix-turn-helix domain-containing protein [Lachnospiraceae bacterium NSJ-143]